ncbi:MAG: hypothetical protein V7708_13145 [Oceanicoccus sp.]
MSPRDDDHIGHVPKITPAHDEIASFQRAKAKGTLSASIGDVPNVDGPATSSSVIMKSTLTAVVLVLLATAGWAGYLHLKLQVAQQSLRNYDSRITDLERQLSVTDESMSESSVAMKVKLRELDSEVRKLWDNVWKKSKQQLAAHDLSLAKQQSSIESNTAFVALAKQLLSKNDSVIEGLSQQLKKAEQMRSQVTANQKAITQQNNVAESAVDKANRVSKDIQKLNGRIKSTEEWIESINGFRRQVNRDISALKKSANPASDGS